MVCLMPCIMAQTDQDALDPNPVSSADNHSVTKNEQRKVEDNLGKVLCMVARRIVGLAQSEPVLAKEPGSGIGAVAVVSQ